MNLNVIGGIEGGATHSHVVLLNETGEILSKLSGPGTNHCLVGMTECQKRISDLVNNAKELAQISCDTPIEALGLSLSGCEQDESNRKLEQGLIATYPNLCRKCVVGSDTEGSIATVSQTGGITCIAGTGSNTVLINPNGTKVQCGGWGYLLGDEGSGWQIARKAVKMCFDDLDNLETAPFPIKQLWQTVKDHFQITHQADILNAFYTDFSKAHIASLCRKVAQLATDGDALSQHIFHDAGRRLARQINAVITHPNTDKGLLKSGQFIRIVCVGSVWISWDLLRPGFVTWIHNNTTIEKLSMVRLTSVMGMGAAYMAADRLHFPLERSYSENFTEFYHYDRTKYIIYT